ncbi:uncharacterized protein [Cherax quadricarinatus]|uniref:uncharacterized protein n=1 Tax=Cherax quadricarinatus TaxID=27406 RepID=UPI00387EDB65
MSMRVYVVVVAVMMSSMMTASGKDGRGRQKRYFLINPTAQIRLDFLINMPWSLALPTFARVNGVSSRSLELRKIEECETGRAEDLTWDPAYERALSRLSVYFAHLELPVLSCQERLICELTADPDTFFPISQIFMKELRLVNGPVTMTDDSLMWRYMSASRQGFTSPIMRLEVCIVAVMAAMVGSRSTTGGSREERYFFTNLKNPIKFCLLLNMPLSLALPTLAPVNGRSLQLSSVVVDKTVPEDLSWDPSYEHSLSRLSLYFDQLQVSAMSCQERLICELTADPDRFSPISQIFMKELRPDYGPVKMTDDSLIWRYMSAAHHGFISPTANCSTYYPTCPLPTDHIIDMDVVKVWKYLSSKMNINLV